MRHSAAVFAIAGAVLLTSSPALAQFAQQQKLVGTGATGKPSRGSGVSLSADGSTAVVGGDSDDSGIGAVWIFTRSGTSWTQQGSKLVPTDTAGAANVGNAVAVSADGNTALVGGWQDDNDKGAAWIFVRTGSTWSQQGSKLVGTGAVGSAIQGFAVSLSADGNTALVGGYNDNTLAGAAWVFTRSGTTWTQQGSKLVGTGAVGAARQGYGVALSADGNTAIVGGTNDNNFAGAAWVFTRSGSTWTQQGGALTGSGASGSAEFGTSVALSADGSMAAVGGQLDNASLGAVWIFTRSGSTWTQQGSKLVGRGSIATPVYQGHSVSLSGDGNLLIEGALGDNSFLGAAWTFVRNDNSWAQAGSKLVGTGAVGEAQQGLSTALSADGLTAIVGGPSNNTSVGAAWIFTLLPHATADFDGDARADAVLFKANGDWSTLTSSSGFTSSFAVNWSAAGYIPVPGDYDGDGIQDPALYNPVSGTWRFLSSGNAYAATIINWGGTGYTAVPGDYDGDGQTDLGVYNTATGVWSILKSSSGYTTVTTVNWGGSGYTPVPGQDFDGDFIDDVAVYQASNGLWAVLKSSAGYASGFSVNWGGGGYTLVPGDYDGDRRADLGLYQRATGGWFVLLSSTGYASTLSANWGGPGYLPVPADFDGDARVDLGLYQPSTGNWYVLKSSSSFTATLDITNWGSGSDVPISSAITVASSDLRRAGDFDGDARSEITVYNSTTGVWSSLTSSSGYTGATNRNWGGTGYAVAPGDYDGDGKTDLGVYQSSTGNWYVLLSSTNFTTAMTKSVGGADWQAVPGDYDGDGKTDFVVYNFSTGEWYGLKSSTNYTTTLSVYLGGAGPYLAVPADYDGDGRTDVGVYDLIAGTWSVLLSSSNYTTGLSKSAGGINYTPVPADYDGDGKADFVVYNLVTGLWYGLKSSTNYTTTVTVSWGGSGYTPVKGDYDGDGRADLAVYQASTGMWYILLSGSNYTTTIAKNWGGPGFTCVPGF